MRKCWDFNAKTNYDCNFKPSFWIFAGSDSKEQGLEELLSAASTPSTFPFAN